MIAVPILSTSGNGAGHERGLGTVADSASNRCIAMVGLSADPMRPSHFAALYMQSECYAKSFP